MSNLEQENWYVVRVRFNRIPEAQRALTYLSIESYVPMETREVVCKGKKVINKSVPILSNLIFVRATFTRISEICGAYKYLYYLSQNVEGRLQAIIVPECQMVEFRDFIEGRYESIKHKRTKLKSGEKIRITSGLFKGSEATFIKESGTIRKNIFVEINGLVVTMPADLLTGNSLDKLD